MWKIHIYSRSEWSHFVELLLGFFGDASTSCLTQVPEQQQTI